MQISVAIAHCGVDWTNIPIIMMICDSTVAFLKNEFVTNMEIGIVLMAKMKDIAAIAPGRFRT